jgi:protein ImuB
VLYENDARYGNRVKTCSAAAMDQGVRPAMPLAEAQTLLISEAAQPSSEPARFVLHDPQRDREALTRLAEWCERFSPIVGLDQTDQPDSLLMDTSGLAHLFGGEQGLARTVVTALRRRGLAARVAIADTVRAAWAVARWGDRGSAQPAGSIVRPGEEAALDGLPLQTLQLPERTDEQLQRLGIRDIGQLKHLSRGSLAARFGELLVERLDQLTGRVQQVIVSHRRQGAFAACWSLEHATTRHDTIEYVLGELLRRLSCQLTERGQGVLQLKCQLVCKEHRPLDMDIGLFRPTVNARHLLALAKMQLALLRLPDAVEEIDVVALSTAPCRQQQKELFADSPRDHPAQLALLVERLSNRMGRDRVVRAELQAEALIESTYRYLPLTGERSSGGRSDPLSPPVCGPMLRPLRLLDPPHPIDMIGIALDGPPAMFHYRRRRYPIARYFGPERIETGWWRGPSVRRDYYRVETETGNRLWLFRNLQDKRWFLHGEF